MGVRAPAAAEPFLPPVAAAGVGEGWRKRLPCLSPASDPWGERCCPGFPSCFLAALLKSVLNDRWGCAATSARGRRPCLLLLLHRNRYNCLNFPFFPPCHPKTSLLRRQSSDPRENPRFPPKCSKTKRPRATPYLVFPKLLLKTC